MPEFKNAHSSQQMFATPESVSGGCSLIFFLPPFSVLFIGLLLAIFLKPAAFPQKNPLPLVTPPPTGIASFFEPEVQYWQPQILEWAEQWQLPPNLIATVMQIESCGNPNVISPAGAIGLFQVMPYHFKPDENPLLPGTNARRGLAYLKRGLETFDGDIRLVLASYNGGIQGASRASSLWPAETQSYVLWGMGIYQDATEGQSTSAKLEEWLAAGGASLCAQARQALPLAP